MNTLTTLFLDLDNTIFPTRSIDKKMVSPFLQIVRSKGSHLTADQLSKVEEELWERSFIEVFDRFNFPQDAIQKSLEALNQIDLKQKISPYSDYAVIRSLNMHRYLITTSVTGFQMNKIDALNIRNDFIDIVIDDPMKHSGGKTAAFNYLMNTYNIEKDEILIIGDNPDSEIEAGRSLGIRTALIDRNNRYNNSLNADYLIRTFDEIPELIHSIGR